MSVDLVVKNCAVVTPDGRTAPGAGVGVVDGKISAIAAADQLPRADVELDAGGNLLLPGVIDGHIHNRSPGYEYKEDWETATRAAAAGGVTTVVGMCNTDPVIDRPAHLELKYELAREQSLVDFQSYAVVTANNLPQIQPLADAGVLGYKVFLSTYLEDLVPPNDGQLLEAMEAVEGTGRRLGFHAENRAIVAHFGERARRESRNTPLDYCRSRPVIAEVEGVRRVVSFAEETGCPIHIFQLSTGSAAAIVLEAKRAGVDVTAETTPHYLWFDERAVPGKGTTACIQPPIRPEAEKEGLWELGIRGGAVDCVATDHSPHTDEEKGLHDDRPVWEVATGFPGLETEVPALLTFVAREQLSLERWVDLHSRRPAKIWGMYPEKGSLLPGTDADFTIVDPTVEWTLDRRRLHSKNTATPFDGETFTGRVSHTIVRGEVVYADDGFPVEPGYGELVRV